MKEIGGFFEIELSRNKEYYPDAIKLNSGRNALLYILKTINPSKIYLPYYICNSVLEPIKKMELDFDFYSINPNFEPINDLKLKKSEWFLYVNYFGINGSNVSKISKKYENLIVDNSQAFYDPPLKHPTFYSPRKFFGVPDGGYLYSTKILNEDLEQDISYKRSQFLLKKLDLRLQECYAEYNEIEKQFSNEPLKLMSKLTQKILSSIDYKKIKLIRENNFQYIHNQIKNSNELKIDLNKINGPMKYPLLVKKEGIKQFLIKNNIYISTYWEEVLERVDKDSFEYDLTKFLIPIPIDQRYNIKDMEFIITKFNEVLNNL